VDQEIFGGGAGFLSGCFIAACTTHFAQASSDKRTLSVEDIWNWALHQYTQINQSLSVKEQLPQPVLWGRWQGQINKIWLTAASAAHQKERDNATMTSPMPAFTRRWLTPPPPILSKAFVGRQLLLETLIQDITAGKKLAITGKQATKAFQGMGGIGKTHLALELAAKLYDYFPGHTLRIDVGHTITDEASTQRPLSRLASYAFDGMAPPGPLQPEQVAAWLSETAPGPFLVIFDDLWHPTPLRILNRALPPTATQLVTTRFAHVAEVIGAAIVQLDRLSPEDGLALLENRLHGQSNTADQRSLAALVQLLGGHALALDIAAAQIQNLSRLATILHELQQGIGQDKLSGLKLAPGDEREDNLERSFALSYEHMDPAQQRLFRALGTFAEESTITADATANIWGMDDRNTAQRALFDLTDLALLTEMEATSPHATFRLHSLLRVYARALLEQQNELTVASSAHAQFFTDLSWQAVTSSPQDYEILDLHVPDLLAALQWSSRSDLSLFPRLLDSLAQFLLLRGQSVLLETYLPHALAAANHLGDRRRSANLLNSLGDLERRLGNIDQARAHYDAALPLYRLERDRLGEANLLNSLGNLELRLGNIEQARAHYDAVLPLYHAERARLGEANLLKSLGNLELRLGNIEQARVHYDAALPLYRAERARLGEANLLKSLGDLELRLGNIEQARVHYDTALPLYRLERDRLGEAYLLKSLGDLERRLGNIEQARAHYDAALPLYRLERDRLGEANLLKSLGDLELRLGNIDQARAHYDAALPLYRLERDRLGEASIYMSVGDMYLAQTMWSEARTFYEKAQPLYIAERDPLGLANTLIDLGRARFEVGDYAQGMSDIQQAAALFRQVQRPDWADRAEQQRRDLQARLPPQHEEKSS
jgi:tetratricopeptide (TPR) repeat protein